MSQTMFAYPFQTHSYKCNKIGVSQPDRYKMVRVTKYIFQSFSW